MFISCLYLQEKKSLGTSACQRTWWATICVSIKMLAIIWNKSIIVHSYCLSTVRDNIACRLKLDLCDNFAGGVIVSLPNTIGFLRKTRCENLCHMSLRHACIIILYKKYYWACISICEHIILPISLTAIFSVFIKEHAWCNWSTARFWSDV